MQGSSDVRGSPSRPAEEATRSTGPTFVLYVPSLDRRRVSAEDTPFVHQLLERHGEVRIDTLPTTELVPTLVTGVLPHEHEIWQVSLRPDAWERRGGPAAWLPDELSRQVQLARHFFDSEFELPVVPHRRRRKFDLHRFKYRRRQERPEIMSEIGGRPTIFGLLGERATYRFGASFDGIPGHLARLPGRDLDFEFLEFYALDLFSHWNLDRPDRMARALRRTDRFVKGLHDRCVAAGVRFALLVDHGQERVRSSIDLRRALRASGARRSDYTFLIEVGAARLWFRTGDAREKIEAALARLDGIRVLTWEEMHAHGVRFPDGRFGEVYVYPEQGRTFFPHDFYDPAANLFLGLRDAKQRPRIRNPRHRGNHGGLPGHPAEEGYLVVADKRWRPDRPRMELIDFVPTMLSLTGAPIPPAMAGTPAYRVVA